MQQQQGAVLEDRGPGGGPSEEPESDEEEDDSLQATQQPVSAEWTRSAGRAGRGRGAQCSYPMFKGLNAGKLCPRNGFHERDGKLYCLNHAKIMHGRARKLDDRIAQPSGSLKRKASAVEPARSEEKEDEAPEVEEGEIPVFSRQQLGLSQPPPAPHSGGEGEQPARSGMDERREHDALKTKYKQKFKRRYQPPEKRASVWDDFRYKNPRKTINRMWNSVGGVAPMFRLPRE